MSESELAVFSQKLSIGRRFLRLLGSCCDPRAHLHLLRMMNYYNHTHVAPRRQIRFGRDCAVSPDVNFANAGRIVIGDRVKIGTRCYIWAGPQHGKVTLADDVLLGPEVFITAATYEYNLGTPVTEQPMREADVRIGRDVWIGARAMILAGVQIGDGCVIGAGAIVTKSLPAGSVAVGAPARTVHQRVGAWKTVGGEVSGAADGG
jgi:acetyltransferase-like isoleucine patch superfamily enzyme